MREKELRIALVCFGGVSLAVYMHGITKEILKLVRASGALHGITDRARRQSATFFDVRDAADGEYDTEPVYFDLLREIGGAVELRVIVDIIAGASAGGVNATMLARALAHDLPMGGLRDLWLQHADVAELLASEAKAGSWSKWFLRPFFWGGGLAGLEFIQDQEVRAKLSLFMRSRWFKPPLDGPKMTALLYDALTAMGSRPDPAASLLPSGQGLDLFVTVTDFYGRQQLMQIHDPPVIHEREHRHVLHFKYRRRMSGAVESDFDLENTPALAFAARATSSIPGAWPPARILEVDELLRDRLAAWPRRAEFIARNFEQYGQMNVDVASVPFVDGSVLNSRPFREAIAAIRGRPAYREVDRRVVYIDPNPAAAGASAPAHHAIPGFFAALKGALSDIPLAEPVTDELSWVARFNERARRLRAMIDSARPHISQLVVEVMTGRHERQVAEAQIRIWRERANSKAARDAGFAYEAYVRLKLASVRSFVARLIMDIRGVREGSPFARAIAEVIDCWAMRAGVSYEPAGSHALQSEAPHDSDVVPNWAAFLLAFDVDYRRRRLHFLIEGQNRLYQMLGSGEFADLDATALDQLKQRFYACLETLERRAATTSINPTTRDLIETIFRTAPSPGEMREVAAYARGVVARHGDKLDLLVAHLGRDIDLKASTQDIDILLSETSVHPRCGMHEVLVNYLGFPFWDVLTFPLMPWREAGEFNEIRVDRISAEDATGIALLGALRLKGVGLNQSAAFLSRAYRENDYLLGRLHAVDRLIDIVADAAGPDAPSRDAIAALKRKAILRILEIEEPYLPTCKAILTALRGVLAEA